jgi:3-hydroxy acid dehydrogenase / malonic semialdehyde reductase
VKRIVLITGATSGFGEACARRFAEAGDDIIITGRRTARLAALKEELEKKFGVNVLTLEFDVRKREDVITCINGMPDNWKAIDILINNAGLALGRDLFNEADLDDWDKMLQTNVNGLLYVSKAVVPFMIKRKKGHIINIGSVAGKEIYERGNVYCASKAAVEALSKSMRIDLLPHRIKVTAIHPGAAETEFAEVRFKGDKEKASKVYTGFTPLSAKDVADTVFYTASLPDNVCINDLVITCTAQADALHFNKVV